MVGVVCVEVSTDSPFRILQRIRFGNNTAQLWRLLARQSQNIIKKVFPENDIGDNMMGMHCILAARIAATHLFG